MKQQSKRKYLKSAESSFEETYEFVPKNNRIKESQKSNRYYENELQNEEDDAIQMKMSFKPPKAPQHIASVIQQQSECQCKYAKKYSVLLQEYLQHRQNSTKEKEKQLQEYVKYRQHLDRTYKQLEAKFQQKNTETHKELTKKLKNLQKQYQEKFIMNQEKEKQLASQVIKLREEVKELQIEKLQIIESNTKMLYELSNSDQLWSDSPEDTINESGANRGIYRNSYQQLVKLYQFVLEQNNALKKQICKMQSPLEQSLKKQIIEVAQNKKKKGVKASHNKTKNLNTSLGSNQESIKCRTIANNKRK